MIFNGANINENIDVSANGGRMRLFRDVGNVTMDTDDVESVDINEVVDTFMGLVRRLLPANIELSQAEIDLTPKEFSLLEYFMRRPGEVLTRTSIIEHVWDFAYDGDSNVVDVYVRYLREKVDRPFARRSIETVRGTGYRLRNEPAHATVDPH